MNDDKTLTGRVRLKLLKDETDSLPDSLESEYNSFLEAGEPDIGNSREISTVSKSEVHKKLSRVIGKDLVKSSTQMTTFFVVISVLGYLVSLALCAQNSLALLPLGYTVAEKLHRLPGVICPMVCGVVFTGIPFVFSMLMLNRFQFRYLFSKLWWVYVSVPLVATFCLLFLPHHMEHIAAEASAEASLLNADYLSDVGWMAIWAASAILTPYILSLAVFLVVKQKKAMSTTK